MLLGAAAGILFGVSDVAIKALTGSVGSEGVLGLVSPWLPTCLLASVLAFFASARGLQKGEAVPVITLTSAAANVSASPAASSSSATPCPADRRRGRPVPGLRAGDRGRRAHAAPVRAAGVATA